MNSRDAILKVIDHEGGAKITDHKADKGGLTKYGISQKAYPELDIRNLTLENAIAIYKRDYWDKIKGDQIKSYGVAFAIFDQAVNRGVVSAIKTAQKAVGQKDDGLLGPMTLNAINAKPEGQFLDSFISLSKKSYQDIVSRNPAQEVFINGWMNRLDSLSDYAKKNIGVVAVSFTSIFLVLGLVAWIILTGPKRA